MTISEERRARAGYAVSALVGLAIALVLAWIAGGEHAGLFSDSGDYLKIATHIRNVWSGTPDATLAAYAAATRFPHGFPLTLALFGATVTHHAPAFLATAACAASASALCWFWYRRETGDAASAGLLLAVFGLSLGVMLLLLDPVSEPLFVAVTLAAFLTSKRSTGGRDWRWLTPVLVGMAPFVRTVGVLLIFAYAATLLLDRQATIVRRVASLLVAVLPFAVWSFASTATGPRDDYSDYLSVERFVAGFGGWSGFAWQPVRFADAFAELFIPRSSVVAFVVAIAILFAAVPGWFGRFKARELDAFFFPLYAAAVLVWPFPEELPRLVYPLLPIVLLFAHAGVRRIAPLPGPAVIAAAIALLVLVPQAPTTAGVLARATAEIDDDLSASSRDSSYLLSGSDDAGLLQLEFHARVFAALEALPDAVPKTDCIYVQSVGLIEANVPSMRAVQIPRELDLSRPLRAQLPACDYLFVIVAPTRQHRFAIGDFMARLQQEARPVQVSRIERGDRPLASVLAQFNDD